MLRPQYRSSVIGVEVDVGFGRSTTTGVAPPVRNWQTAQLPYANVVVAYLISPTAMVPCVPARSVPATEMLMFVLPVFWIVVVAFTFSVVDPTEREPKSIFAVFTVRP